MNIRTSTFALGQVALGLLLFSWPLEAAPTRNGIAMTQSGKPRKWDSLPISICSTPGLPDAARSALEKAIQVWNRDLGFSVFKTGCTVASNDLKQSDQSGPSVYWVTSGFGNSGDPLALARTLSSFDDSTGAMLDADILINADAFDWSAINVDLESVLIHELGHALGLQHLHASIVSVMNQYPYQSGIKRLKLGNYEREAVQLLYKKSGKKLPPFFDSYFGNSTNQARKELRRFGRSSADDFYMEAFFSITLKDFKAAEKSLKSAIKINPSEPLIHYRLFEALQAQGKKNESEKVLVNLTRDWPHFYEGLVELALLKLQKKETAEAASLLDRVIQINPVHYPACMLLKELTKKPSYDDCINRFAPKE